MMQPHPQMAEILAEQRANPPPNPETLPIDEARRNFERNTAAWNMPLPAMDAQDITIAGINCRLLTPGNPGAGLVLFVHGGGWTFGSPTSHERFARLIAQHAGVGVLVPDYRLAPEHPAPAAIEDILAVIGGLDTIVPPTEKLVLSGDSAGANIALGAALSRPSRAITMLSLLYGCFAPIFDTGSHQRNGDGQFGLQTQRMKWYWNNWLGAQSDPRAAPLYGDFVGLPPCHLLAAALDPLCDDSFLLANRLVEAGEPVRLDVVPGVVHGFLQMTARLAPAMTATEAIAAEIAAALR
jgi:acetyl esterase